MTDIAALANAVNEILGNLADQDSRYVIVLTPDESGDPTVALINTSDPEWAHAPYVILVDTDDDLEDDDLASGIDYDDAITRLKAQTTTYTAAIATASDCVAGEFCDVQVGANDATAALDDNGDEITEYTMSDRMVLDAIETDVRTDDPDKLSRVEAAADAILDANGWRRTEAWDVAYNALYAAVERI